ncbi:MAG TPA: hypothetical protein VFD43_10415, partial [Planctomycetota bacterium]|nr:hypothetical protein [Planctomycetota bacterium]
MRALVLPSLLLVVLAGAVRPGEGDGAPPPGTPPGQVWASEVGTLGPFDLAFGDGGGQLLVVGTGGKAWIYSSFDHDPPTAFSALDLDFYGGLGAAAGDTDVHLTVTYDVLDIFTSQGHLRCYGSASSLPLWDFVFAPQLFSSPGIDVSRDGQTIVSYFVLEQPPTNEFRVHDPGTGAVTRFLHYPIQEYTGRFDLSPDGSVLAHSSNDGTGNTFVIDVASGDLLFTTPGTIPGEQALSRRGGVLVVRQREVGVAWHVRAFVRGPAGYVQVLDVPTPDSEWPGDMAVSDDGRVVAAAWYDGALSPWLATARAYDVPSGALLLERELAANPLSPLQNAVGDLELSAGGERLALGVWGGGTILPSGTVSELTVWDPQADALVASFPASGTVFEVELSADGSRLAAHRLPGHANSGYTTTWVRLYDVGGADLALHGVPSVGGSLTAEVFGPAGATAALLAAAALAPQPLVVGGAGTLFLDPATLAVAGVAPVGAAGSAPIGLAVPAAPALV